MDMSETRMFMGGGDGSIFLVNLVMHAIRPSYEYKVTSISPSIEKDGAVISFAGHDKTITCLCVSIDGKVLLTGSEDTTIKMWDTDSRKQLRSFTGHTGSITSICLVHTPPQLKDASNLAPLAAVAPFKKFQSTGLTDDVSSEGTNLNTSSMIIHKSSLPCKRMVGDIMTSAVPYIPVNGGGLTIEPSKPKKMKT